MLMTTFIARLQARMPVMVAPRFTNRVEPDETLVPDVRGNPSPAQMVDDKVKALQGSCARSLQPQRRKT